MEQQQQQDKPTHFVQAEIADKLNRALMDHVDTFEIPADEVVRRALRKYLTYNRDVIEAGPFECHITFNPAGLRQHEVFALEDIVKGAGFKFSKIDGDPILGDKVFAYGTKYGKSMTDLIEAMDKLKILATERGYRVERLKVERIVYDTKGAGIVLNPGDEGDDDDNDSDT